MMQMVPVSVLAVMLYRLSISVLNTIQLLGDAVIFGWDRDEVLEAIIAVTDNTAMALHANELLSTETELRKFRRRHR